VCGSSYKDLTDEKTFTLKARKEAGHQLNQVQKGLDPADWKPFDVVGPGKKKFGSTSKMGGFE
jgi:phage-related protein